MSVSVWMLPSCLTESVIPHRSESCGLHTGQDLRLPQACRYWSWVCFINSFPILWLLYYDLRAAHSLTECMESLLPSSAWAQCCWTLTSGKSHGGPVCLLSTTQITTTVYEEVVWGLLMTKSWNKILHSFTAMFWDLSHCLLHLSWKWLVMVFIYNFWAEIDIVNFYFFSWSTVYTILFFKVHREMSLHCQYLTSCTLWWPTKRVHVRCLRYSLHC